jgi:hypothetical protein
VDEKSTNNIHTRGSRQRREDARTYRQPCRRWQRRTASCPSQQQPWSVGPTAGTGGRARLKRLLWPRGCRISGRCAPLYSLSLLLLLGPAQLPPSLSCPCFSPHHPAGEPTEGRTRRAGTSTARSSSRSLEPAAGHAPSSPGGYLSTLAFNIMVVDCLSYTGI